MEDRIARLLLCAWLHDPPDKALQIQGHEQRTLDYLRTIIDIDQQEIKLRADPLAAATERLPVPDHQHAPETKVDAPELEIKHLLTGESKSGLADKARKLSLDKQRIRELVAQLASGLERKETSTPNEAKFYSLWRRLPQEMAKLHPAYAVLPADTRTPDHTIWHHMDTVAALVAACHDPQGNELLQERAAFLSFSVGPVQSFIASARSLRDLWSGSMILAYLTARAMEPVLDEYGPTAIIYPVLRGNPLIDLLWLKQQKGFSWVPGNPAQRLVPCLPNRFLAVVSRGPRDVEEDLAQKLAKEVEEKAKKAWQDLAKKVRDELKKKIVQVAPEWAPDWDHHWQHAIKNQFDFRTVVLPWIGDEAGKILSGQDPQAKDNPDRLLMHSLAGDLNAPLPEQIKQIRQLARDVSPTAFERGLYNKLGWWQLRLELLGRLGQADKLLRKVPEPASVGNGQWVPPKCSMTGETEAMGPASLAQFRKFWEQLSGQNGSQPLSIGGVRIRRGERLGSVALVKRFAGPVVFLKEFELKDDRHLLRMADTATVAARCWLERAKQFHDPKGQFNFQDDQWRPWSGHWLHWHDQDEAEPDEQPPEELKDKIRILSHPDRLGPPPTYYAVLMMDGDCLGQWLRGKLSPEVLQSYHPKLVAYFKKKKLADHPGLKQPRPVTPAFHMAISEALANFSLYFVPEIVEKYRGQLVYAGGDDVLALLPLETALHCAAELNETYQKPWEKDQIEGQGIPRLLMGPRATMSAALVVAHFKDDLRSVLQAARSAEKRAKSAGRDVLQLVIRRRSGEHSAALCPWEFVAQVDRWRELFSPRPFCSSSDNDKESQSPASDRWVYQLRRLLKTARDLPLEAQKALLRRQLNRAEKQTRCRVAQALASAVPGSSSPSHHKDAGEWLAWCYEQYINRLNLPNRWPEEPAHQRDGNALEHFVLLWQAASFLARGRDA